MKQKLYLANLASASEMSGDVVKHGEKFHHVMKNLSSVTGGINIGCSLIEVPPGKTAYPYHYNCENEESLYILEGNAELRYDNQIYIISKGDYISFPAESPAHQLINTGDTTLKFLCISTMNRPEVTVYPDSGKIAVKNSGIKPGSESVKYYKGDVEVGFWEGEQQ